MLFDKVTMTDKEQYIIDTLKIIVPTIDRIAFVAEIDDSLERYSKVRLSSDSQIFSMKSMGDGINHILSIILALVNTENGVFTN